MKKIKKIILVSLSVLLVLLNINVKNIDATEVSGSLMGMVPYKVWINKTNTAETTILGQTILESKNFDHSGKTSQAVVAAPATGDAEFKLNAEFYLNQAATVMGYELWNILSKPATASIPTLSSAQGASYSHVDLVVEFNDYLKYTDSSNVIRNAYFDSATWRPIFVFDGNNYSVLEDFRDNSKNTYQPGVSKKVFDIHTRGAKKFIIRVVPIADVQFNTAQKTAPLKFGLDEANNFTVSSAKSNEIAEKRRRMTEQQIADERAAINNVVNANSKLTPAQTQLIKEYNVYATGEVTGKVFVDKSKLSGLVALFAPSSLPLTGMIPASGIAVTYKNPSVLFVKNDGSDQGNTAIREDMVENGRVYVDYNKSIPTDTLTNYSVPANPTRDGYEFLGWATDEAATTPNFDPATAVITADTTAYAVWKKVVTVKFDKNIGSSEIVHTAKLEAGKSIDSDTTAESTMPANPTHPQGFVFKEWNTEANGNGTAFTSSTVVDADKTVYAIYSEKYNVSYKFTIEDGTAVPEEIVKQTPATTQVDKGANVVPSKSAFDEVIGYEFKGWKTDQFDNVTTNVEFEGTWAKKELDLTYQFLAKQPERQNEVDATVSNKLPASGKIRIGEAVPNPGTYDDVNVDGHDAKLVFVGWYLKSGTSLADTEKVVTKEEILNNREVKVTGIWDYKKNEYTINYKFTSATAGKTLPASIVNYQDDAKVISGQTVDVKPAKIQTLKDDVNDGVWNFKAWDVAQQTVNRADVTFNGTYEFTPNQYDVEYKFTSATADKTLPNTIQNYVDTVKVVNGERIVAKAAPVATQADDVNDGVWNFKSWDNNEKIVSKANVVFNGTYEFTPNQYDVIYKFKSEDGSALPTSISKPTAVKAVVNGQKYTAAKPEAEVEDTARNGKWIFVGYENETITVNKGNIEFVGVYKFVNKTYKATYEFVKKVGEVYDLPQGLTNRLVNSEKDKLINGDIVTPNDIDTSDYVDSTNDGTWTFVSWDVEELMIIDENVKFEGTWRFLPNKHKAIYEFVKDEDLEIDLPQEITNRLLNSEKEQLIKGDVVGTDSINVSDYEDSTNDGVWLFVEWDFTKQTIVDKNVKFVGTWTFLPNEHKATYEFIKDASVSKDLPRGLLDRLMGSEKDALIKGDTVTTTGIDTSDYIDVANKGVWTFVSWNYNRQTIVDKDVKFVGTWTFKENQYRVVYVVESADGKMLPEEITRRTPAPEVKNVSDTVSAPANYDSSDFKTNEGIYTFKGWNIPTAPASMREVIVKGTWNFVKLDSSQEDEKPPVIKPLEENKVTPEKDVKVKETAKKAVDTSDVNITSLISMLGISLFMMLKLKEKNK